MVYYLVFKKADNKEHTIRDIIYDRLGRIYFIRTTELDNKYKFTSLCCCGYCINNITDVLKIKTYLINEAINNKSYASIDLNSFDIIQWS